EAKLRGLISKIDQQARNKNLKLGITEWNHTAGHWGWARAWLLTHYNALNAARMFNMYQRLGDHIRIANRSNMTNSCCSGAIQTNRTRSEEHTSELQSREKLVCRLLLEKKKKTTIH